MRPITGLIDFNVPYIKTDPTQFQASEGKSWENEVVNMLSTAQHELTHVLGFSGGMF